jgi:hypothetical protein
MKFAKTDNPSFIRDLTTGALINSNKDELALLKKQRSKELERDQQLNDLKKQVEELTRLIRER